jgi:hypothetical protein
MFTRGSAERISAVKINSRWSAKGPRTIRGSSVQPVSIGYTEGMFSEQSADGPPRVRGQSAVGEKNLPEIVPDGYWSDFSKADGPRLRRMVGSARYDLYGVSLSLSPTKPQPHHPKGLSSSLSSTWEEIKVKVVCRDSWTVREHHQTLRDNLIMSSRYFVKSLNFVLGFHHWKE